jgi:hypothetical protein
VQWNISLSLDISQQYVFAETSSVRQRGTRFYCFLFLAFVKSDILIYFKDNNLLSFPYLNIPTQKESIKKADQIIRSVCVIISLKHYTTYIDDCQKAKRPRLLFANFTISLCRYTINVQLSKIAPLISTSSFVTRRRHKW